MAFIDFQFHSDCLKQAASAYIILPQVSRSQIGMEGKREKSFKTLYLLHGLSDDHSIWMRRTSIERYAAAYGIAVVMPCAGRSWYTDTTYGEAYYTYITEELPALCRSYFAGMSDRREDNYVAGLSMGGYGAMKIALRNPGRYAGAACFSSAFDVARRVANLDFGQAAYWQSIFGDLSAFPGSENDVYALAERLGEDGAPMPRFYLSCGESDGLLPDTRRMREILERRGAELRYREAPGIHDWLFWDSEIQLALSYFFG